VIDALQELAFKHPSYGFRKLLAYIRRSGKTWNHKKVYRIYKLLKLNKKRKGKRRLPARVKQPLKQQTTINSSWNMDFTSDAMVGNRKFRTLNIMDDCTREALAIEIDTSLSAKRVTRTLDRIIEQRGKPTAIRTAGWPRVYLKGVGTLGLLPGHKHSIYPTRKTNAERIHRTLQSTIQ
jgi:putative transposase